MIWPNIRVGLKVANYLHHQDNEVHWALSITNDE